MLPQHYVRPTQLNLAHCRRGVVCNVVPVVATKKFVEISALRNPAATGRGEVVKNGARLCVSTSQTIRIGGNDRERPVSGNELRQSTVCVWVCGARTVLHSDDNSIFRAEFHQRRAVAGQDCPDLPANRRSCGTFISRLSNPDDNGTSWS